MKHNASYTMDDIRKYVSGQMSHADMRKLELASLSDPFLADAIEGYMNADANLSDQHLDQISAYISKKEDQRKIIPIWGQQWFRVAALFIIIAGAVMISRPLWNKNTNEELAQTDQKRNKIPEGTTTKPADTGTATNIGTKDAATKNVLTERQRSARKQQIQDRIQRSITAREEGIAGGQQKAAVANAPTTIQEAAAPPPAAMRSATTDNKGKITDQKESAVLNEVVVTGSSRMRRKESPAATSSFSNDMMVDIDTNAVQRPIKGWDDLRRAIINVATHSKLNRRTGFAIISFSVDRNNKVWDVDIEETDNDELAEAINKLISTQTFWNRSTNRIRLTIRIAQ